jgi:hypothetical protein
MATEPARRRLRHIWQLPTFALGLTAVWAAATYVTPTPNTAARLNDRVETLATLLERSPTDLAEIEKQVKPLAESAASTPKTHFTMGSAYSALASARPADSADLWKLALQHFDRVDANALAPQDAARMQFRRAKAQASIARGEPLPLIAALMSPPPGEDTREVPRLIAECALRQTPPDLTRARDELTHYLAGPQSAGAAIADRCKLKLAELHAALNAPQEARKWLVDIAATAPADVLATAKVALARQAAADKQWADAAALLEAALAMPGLAVGEKLPIRVHLAEALARQGNAVQAAVHYEAVSRDNGPLGAQASLRMAELRAADPAFKGKRGDSVDWLERAAVNLDRDGATPAVQEVYAQVVNLCMNDGDYASALRAVEAKAKAAGQAQDKLKADVTAAWGLALKKANDPAAKAKLLSAAEQHIRVAGAAPKLEDHIKLLGLYEAAGDKDKALAAVQQVLASKTLDRASTAAMHLKRAELLPTNDFNELKISLEEAMSTGGADAQKARLKLGQLYISRAQEIDGQVELGTVSPKAAALRNEALTVRQLGQSLVQQCADLATVPAAVQPVHEQALFELGRLHLRDGKFLEAETRFKKQLAHYPTGTFAGYGRLWLVCSLLQQHRQDPGNRRLLEDALTWLKPLAMVKDDYLRTYGEIWTANTLLELGDVGQALPLTKSLVEKYKGKSEELIAAKLLFYAHLKGSAPAIGEAGKVLDRMEQVLAALPATAYPNDPEYSQARWKSELPRLRDEFKRFQQ